MAARLPEGSHHLPADQPLQVLGSQEESWSVVLQQKTRNVGGLKGDTRVRHVFKAVGSAVHYSRL